MAHSKKNGNGNLEEAMAALIQAQATMVPTQAYYLVRKAETDNRMFEIEQELSGIKKRFDRIESVLVEHNQNLKYLADKVGEKIGFKVPASAKTEA